MYSESCATELLFVGGGDGPSKGRKSPRCGLWSELRRGFRWAPREMPRGEEHGSRRSIRKGTGRKLFLGGSDPTLSGLAAAQRL